MTRDARPTRPILAALAALALGAGCDAFDTPQPKAKPIIGRTTQDIRRTEDELKPGNQVATTQITAKDPITLQGNAYVTSIGRVATLEIEHALNLYQAEHGEFPKTYEEFMDNIIKANNIRLPQLPSYQKYTYDAPNHKLIIIENLEEKNRPLVQP